MGGQGRQCGYSVSLLTAAARAAPVEEVGFPTIRPPLKPIMIGELASLDGSVEVRAGS